MKLYWSEGQVDKVNVSLAEGVRTKLKVGRDEHVGEGAM